VDYPTSIVCMSVGVGGDVGFCHLVASGAAGKHKNFVSQVFSIACLPNVELT